MKIISKSILILVAALGFAPLASACDLNEASKLYKQYADVFEKMNGVTAWGYLFSCADGSPCLDLGTVSDAALANIKSIYPNGLVLGSCNVLFEVTGPISTQQ